jgi:hypothetical protein
MVKKTICPIDANIFRSTSSRTNPATPRKQRHGKEDKASRLNLSPWRLHYLQGHSLRTDPPEAVPQWSAPWA